MNERGAGNQLTWREHLDVNPEVVLAATPRLHCGP
jgi:hypothetical protein